MFKKRTRDALSESWSVKPEDVPYEHLFKPYLWVARIFDFAQNIVKLIPKKKGEDWTAYNEQLSSALDCYDSRDIDTLLLKQNYL